MAFPFAFVPGFRQRLLVAISTTSVAGVAAVGCSTPPPRQQAVSPAQGGQSATQSAGAGGMAGSTPSGGAGAAAGAGAGAVASVAGVGGAQSAGAGGSRSGGAGAVASAGQGGMSGAGGRAGSTSPLSPPDCPIGPPECFTRAEMERKAKYGCNMIPDVPPRLTDAEVQQHFLPNGCVEHPFSCNGCCLPAVAPGVPQADGSCCYVFCSTSCCGRPLMVEGQPRLAAVERRSDWLQGFVPSAPGDWNARIASEWLEDARMEHASIASFARFTLDLLAFGAPSELVERAQRAALEEVEHARQCFGLAARYGAGERGPAPLAAADLRGAPSLWHAALAAFDEGCIGETLAALQARAALEHAADPEVQRALTHIADQELSHAELAWRFVTWSAVRLGAPLTHELERRLSQLRIAPEAIAESEPAAAVEALHAAGRLTAADKHHIALAAFREVIAPCLAAIARPADET